MQLSKSSSDVDAPLITGAIVSTRRTLSESPPRGDHRTGLVNEWWS
jgi:hypothetical protein